VMLLHPIWLFLAIPLALSLWLWRMPSRLLLILRGLILLLLLLALCGTVLRLPSQAGTIVVVADRSQSMPLDRVTAQKQAIDLLLAQLRKTRTNIEFLMQVSKSTAGNGTD